MGGGWPDQARRIAGTHHQTCGHLWMSGTPGTVYYGSMEEGETL